MMPWWGLAVLAVGFNLTLWALVGCLRLADYVGGWWRNGLWGEVHPPRSFTVNDVAVLIPAHNEETVIADSLEAIMKLVPRENVHVVSDGSTDATVGIAAESGANVIATRCNVGKAGALQEAIERFRLVERFPVILLLDADTRIQPGYFEAALPLFDKPKVVAVAGCVRTTRDRRLSLAGNVLVGHRQRIYSVGQRALKFGQTWHRLNATHIVPGFASMYRTEILPRIEMNPPGLVIEDFNMTFEVYQKRLGKVAFNMSAVAVTQDPDKLHDYICQSKRWALGLWQTVRRHPPRANLFTAMLALLLLELITSSTLYLLLPLVLIILATPLFVDDMLSLAWFAQMHGWVGDRVTLPSVLFGVVIPDYAMTCLVALVERRPRLLLCGLFFLFLRLVDAAIGMYTLPLAWLSRSDGRWRSPTRRKVTEALPAGGRRVEQPALGAPAVNRTQPKALPPASDPVPELPITVRPDAEAVGSPSFAREETHASGQGRIAGRATG